jgi:LPXTG-motif cell wall-anchored protein
MELNYFALAIIGLVLMVLILFLVFKNKKDRRELENKLNQDYKKPYESEHTEDTDDLKNT